MATIIYFLIHELSGITQIFFSGTKVADFVVQWKSELHLQKCTCLFTSRAENMVAIGHISYLMWFLSLSVSQHKKEYNDDYVQVYLLYICKCAAL